MQYAFAAIGERWGRKVATEWARGRGDDYLIELGERAMRWQPGTATQVLASHSAKVEAKRLADKQELVEQERRRAEYNALFTKAVEDSKSDDPEVAAAGRAIIAEAQAHWQRFKDDWREDTSD